MNIQTKRMRSAASDASMLLKSLANPHRLILLCELTQGERSVGELAELMELRQSTVSQHLALLRKDGLVATRREGQTIWYSLASEPAGRLLATLYDVFCRPAQVCAPKARSRPKGRG